MSALPQGLNPDPETAKVREYVLSSKVKDWPRMSGEATIRFRRFTGAGDEAYNLVRKGPRIFAVGHEVALCVYNHTREF